MASQGTSATGEGASRQDMRSAVAPPPPRVITVSDAEIRAAPAYRPPVRRKQPSAAASHPPKEKAGVTTATADGTTMATTTTTTTTADGVRETGAPPAASTADSVVESHPGRMTATDVGVTQPEQAERMTAVTTAMNLSISRSWEQFSCSSTRDVGVAAAKTMLFACSQ